MSASGIRSFCTEQYGSVRQFTEEFPCDLLFQDQVGGRMESLDFNPAALDTPPHQNLLKNESPPHLWEYEAVLPRRKTVVDLATVVGATRGRYIRLSATKLGPAWLVNNFNLQFGKVKIVFE